MLLFSPLRFAFGFPTIQRMVSRQNFKKKSNCGSVQTYSTCTRYHSQVPRGDDRNQERFWTNFIIRVVGIHLQYCTIQCSLFIKLGIIFLIDIHKTRNHILDWYVQQAFHFMGLHFVCSCCNWQWIQMHLKQNENSTYFCLYFLSLFCAKNRIYSKF